MVFYGPTISIVISQIFFFDLGVDRAIYVGGQPFLIRGTNYSSNYLDGPSSNPWYVEENQLDYDLADIKSSGFNTVKIYADENNASEHLSALDKIANAGLRALVLRFITYDVDYSIATGDSNRTEAINKFTGMVDNLKGHEAIIGWGFANENNLNLNTTSEEDWYSLVEAAIFAGKEIDNTRFYFTVEGELGTYPGDDALPSLDVVGANIYRGTTFTDLTSDIVSLTNKPFFLTEFGINRLNNTTSEQQDQANEVLSLLREAERSWPIIAGWVHFKFTHISNSSSFWHSSVPLEQGVNHPRTKYILYNTLKDFLTLNGYGE